MNAGSIRRLILRWLAIWAVILAVLLLAGVITHWYEVKCWLFSVADSLVSFGIQVFFMVVGIQMMLGWFRRM